MPKKRQLVTSNNCFELGKVGLLRYSNEKHALEHVQNFIIHECRCMLHENEIFESGQITLKRL